MAVFALLLLAALLQLGTVFGRVHDLVEGAVGASSPVPVHQREVREGVRADRRVHIEVLLEIGVEEKAKCVDMLAVAAWADLKLVEELAVVLLGQVFAPIFLLFSHVI